MKLFVFLIFAALIAGVVFHEEISDYAAGFSGGSYGSGGGSSIIGSVQSVGDKSSAAFGRVGNAFGR